MMFTRSKWLVGGLLVLGLTLSAQLDAEALTDATSLIRRIETQYQSKTSHSVFRLKVVTQSYSREMSLESWGQGREKMRSKVLSPKKDAGTATLKVGDEMWNFLPKIDRLMKIPTSMMGDSWMGSHLTNDDLVKGSKIDELYTFKVTKETAKEAVIVATPRPKAAVVWGSITYQLDLEHMIPTSIQYFDEDGELVRTLEFDQVRKVGGRTLPMRMRYVPADEPGEYTEMVYEKLEFDHPLSDSLFSVRSLRR
jgi:outer membrane lipoprotein-sorting protein